MKRNEHLIECATTVLEDTYDMLGDEDLLLMVTDGNGCVLSVVGHDSMQQEMQALGIKQGCFLSEGKLAQMQSISVSTLTSHVKFLLQNISIATYTLMPL